MRGFVDSLRASSNSLYSRVGGTLRTDEPDDDDDYPDLLGLNDDRQKDDSFGEFKGASPSPSQDVWQLLAAGQCQQQVEQPGSSSSGCTTGTTQDQERQHIDTRSEAVPDLLDFPGNSDYGNPVGLLAAAYHGFEANDDDPFGLGLSNGSAGSSSRPVTDRVRDDRAATAAAAESRSTRASTIVDDDVNLLEPQSDRALRQQSTSRQQQPNGGRVFASAFDRFETFPALPGSGDQDASDSENDDYSLAGEHRQSSLIASSSRPNSGSVGGRARAWAEGSENGLGWDADYETVPIYVVPLFGADSMVVVPAPKRAPPKEQHDLVRGIVSQGKKVQKKVAGAWDSLKDSDPDSLKGKVYRTGQAQLESLSPQERLLGGIPEYAKQLQVVHAPSVNPQEVLNYLTRTLKELSLLQRYKQIGTAALLPVTAVVDAVVIPGPGIMTGLTSYHLYHASKAVAGAQRLKKFMDAYGGIRGQQKGLFATLAGAFEGAGGSKAEEEELDETALQFIVDDRLSRFYERELRDDHGLMPEEELDALVQELDAPASLAEVLHQLRRRELRAKEKKAAAMQSGSSSMFALH